MVANAQPWMIRTIPVTASAVMLLLLLVVTVEKMATAFTTTSRYRSMTSRPVSTSSLNPTRIMSASGKKRTTVSAAPPPGGGSDEQKKKRKRKRKSQPAAGAGAETTASASSTAVDDSNPVILESLNIDSVIDDFDDIPDDEEIDLNLIRDVASFKFDGPNPTRAGAGAAADETVDGTTDDTGAIPLPDIKDTIRRKEMEAEMARMEEEEQEKTKIDRSDRTALLKLLEQQPYADADDSFFQEQEYTTVSALLGERAKPFLGIPTGPLQVGHFIGALVIVLMAFVEYPGFPLTNLPTPLRGALQGGLGTVYAINAVLAVLAVFKAGERGQPALLWIAKTFSVGGLAYDQLTQLPTLEQIEEAKARKGKRALSKKKKQSLSKYN